MDVKLYDEDDLRSTDYQVDGAIVIKGKRYKWEFIAGLCGDNAELFGDWDNHMMTDRLKECGAITDKDCDDSESCCFYCYFVNKQAGRRFIKKLNKYILEKARLVEQATNF